jgi:hypothetical protein
MAGNLTLHVRCVNAKTLNGVTLSCHIVLVPTVQQQAQGVCDDKFTPLSILAFSANGVSHTLHAGQFCTHM